MAALVKIVSEEDWKVITKYLKGEEGVVLIPQHIYNEKALFGGWDGTVVDYDFGGEPDVYLDLIESVDHIFWDSMGLCQGIEEESDAIDNSI